MTGGRSSRRSPSRSRMSPKATPAAATSTTIWSASGGPTWRSTARRTSGPPQRVANIARPANDEVPVGELSGRGVRCNMVCDMVSSRSASDDAVAIMRVVSQTTGVPTLNSIRRTPDASHRARPSWAGQASEAILLWFLQCGVVGHLLVMSLDTFTKRAKKRTQSSPQRKLAAVSASARRVATIRSRSSQ